MWLKWNLWLSSKRGRREDHTYSLPAGCKYHSGALLCNTSLNPLKLGVAILLEKTDVHKVLVTCQGSQKVADSALKPI